MNRKPLLLLCSCLIIAGSAVLPASAGAAATHAKVGPHQYFDGLVNGSLGIGSPAVIKVVCPGPAGQTGHPLAGQTVEVELPKAILSTSGYTGDDATYIAAFFGPPPPSGASSGQVKFTKYGLAKPISTSLTVPCGGTGQVTFVPFPESPPTSRSTSVSVEFANVAA
ncbi:MAG: hypothetical protein ABSF84_08090 [Acidimicrobiales bacterium]|jgi:hypothetical protein